MDRNIIDTLDSILIEYIKHQITYEVYKEKITKILDNYISSNIMTNKEINHLKSIISDNYVVDLAV